MAEAFGLPRLITAMARRAELWGMGHGQALDSLDLGLGWTYYGLTRTLQPRLAVVIGSWRGFAPMVIAQAIQDSAVDGKLLFIDPSLVDDHWCEGVDAYFAAFGILCIDHHRTTTQDFIQAPAFKGLVVDLLFVDGLHTYEQCKLEYEAFEPHLSGNAITLFHDSTSRIESQIYGKRNPYRHSVWRYIEELKQRGDLQVFDLPIDQGITLVRKECAATAIPAPSSTTR